MAFETNVRERKNVHCRSASLKYGNGADILRWLFFLDSFVLEG